MFLFCTTGVLWSLSCPLSVIFVILTLGVKGTEENVEFIAYGILFYMAVLQILNILMLRYFRWPRWFMVGFSVFSTIMMIFAIINFSSLNPDIYYPSIYYVGSVNLLAAIWSCFYYSSFLCVKFIRQQAAKYQAVHGYDPIRWRKDNPRRLF